MTGEGRDFPTRILQRVSFSRVTPRDARTHRFRSGFVMAPMRGSLLAFANGLCYGFPYFPKLTERTSTATTVTGFHSSDQG